MNSEYELELKWEHYIYSYSRKTILTVIASIVDLFTCPLLLVLDRNDTTERLVVFSAVL